MEIYTLVGKSGTGKSFHAMELCHQYNIEGIIDDGLFIYGGTVVAGTSAKRDATKIGAVKTALFLDDGVRSQVVAAIREKAPDSILILGTSVGMVDKIILRLGLLDGEPEGGTGAAGAGDGGPEGDGGQAGELVNGCKSIGDCSEEQGEPVNRCSLEGVHRIFIEDITSEEERTLAHDQREKLGKHVIPAPALQLKRNFAGYFLDPLRLLRGKDVGAAAERTVVRPTYSYLGEYVLDERVIEDIASCAAREIPGVISVIRVAQDPRPEAYRLMVTAKLRRGCAIWETAQALQNRIGEQIELMTAFNVTEVDIEVRALK